MDFLSSGGLAFNMQSFKKQVGNHFDILYF
ncbi:Uncharacterised protein [uncultured Bacteroides sp.]|nr:Uncharacterised protein [uncultured Bacteroides sp.]